MTREEEIKKEAKNKYPYISSILTQIMINDKLERDTSFIRVKNYITNKCRDMLLNSKIINYSKEE